MHQTACIESCRTVATAEFAVYNANTRKCVCGAGDGAGGITGGTVTAKEHPSLCSAAEANWVSDSPTDLPGTHCPACRSTAWPTSRYPPAVQSSTSRNRSTYRTS